MLFKKNDISHEFYSEIVNKRKINLKEYFSDFLQRKRIPQNKEKNEAIKKHANNSSSNNNDESKLDNVRKEPKLAESKLSNLKNNNIIKSNELQKDGK